jgi:ABC-type uncharacterized transport system involved in gliding motility auxiliary subunit
MTNLNLEMYILKMFTFIVMRKKYLNSLNKRTSLTVSKQLYDFMCVTLPIKRSNFILSWDKFYEFKIDLRVNNKFAKYQYVYDESMLPICTTEDMFELK